jgi:hypothetical protein
MWPVEGTMPAMARIRLDFPDPDGPMIANRSPVSTNKSMERNT